MRAVSLHRDVLVATSAVLQVNCVIVRGPVDGEGETFVIDSPVLPDELDALPALLEQAGFPTPSGLLATHGDWDHLLGRLAFPGVALGCRREHRRAPAGIAGRSPARAARVRRGSPIERPRPLALGLGPGAARSPGAARIGDHELELHAADGHTADGMAVWFRGRACSSPATTSRRSSSRRSRRRHSPVPTRRRSTACRARCSRAEMGGAGSRWTVTGDRALGGAGRGPRLPRVVDGRAVDGRPEVAALPARAANAAQRRLHAENLTRRSQMTAGPPRVSARHYTADQRVVEQRQDRHEPAGRSVVASARGSDEHQLARDRGPSDGHSSIRMAVSDRRSPAGGQ